MTTALTTTSPLRALAAAVLLTIAGAGLGATPAAADNGRAGAEVIQLDTLHAAAADPECDGTSTYTVTDLPAHTTFTLVNKETGDKVAFARSGSKPVAAGDWVATVSARAGLELATGGSSMVYGEPHIPTAAECAAAPAPSANPMDSTPSEATTGGAADGPTGLRSSGGAQSATDDERLGSTDSSQDTSAVQGANEVQDLSTIQGAESLTAPAAASTDSSTATAAAGVTVGVSSLTCGGTCYSRTDYTERHGYWVFSGRTTGLAAGATIGLYYSHNNGAWVRIRQPQVSSTGTWRASTAITSPGTYRWMVTYGGSPTSSTAAKTATYTRTATRSAAYTRRSGSFASTASAMQLWGTVRPLVSGRTVTIQRLSGGVWSDVGTATTGTDRVFRWSTTLGTNTLNRYIFRVRYLTEHYRTPKYSSPITLSRVLPADSVRLSDAQARGVLTSKGVPVVSSGGCTSRYNGSCTALDTIRTATIRQAVRIKDSGCPIVVTGGTETGHATGTYSHWTGYKIDLSMMDCVSSFVGRVAASQGGPYWYSYPTRYFNEVNHWDLTVVE
ncbi:hypothetical protein ACQP1U_15310 [Actinomycetota bacterium]